MFKLNIQNRCDLSIKIIKTKVRTIEPATKSNILSIVGLPRDLELMVAEYIQLRTNDDLKQLLNIDPSGHSLIKKIAQQNNKLIGKFNKDPDLINSFISGMAATDDQKKYLWAVSVGLYDVVYNLFRRNKIKGRSIFDRLFDMAVERNEFDQADDIADYLIVTPGEIEEGTKLRGGPAEVPRGLQGKALSKWLEKGTPEQLEYLSKWFKEYINAEYENEESPVTDYQELENIIGIANQLSIECKQLKKNNCDIYDKYVDLAIKSSFENHNEGPSLGYLWVTQLDVDRYNEQFVQDFKDETVLIENGALEDEGFTEAMDTINGDSKRKAKAKALLEAAGVDRYIIDKHLL